MLIGDPNFDLAAASTATSVTESSARRSTDMRELRFTRLPATRVEVEAIEALLRGLAPDPVFLLTDENATEERLFAVHTPRILHLATHGFFLSDQKMAFDSGRGIAFSGFSPETVDMHGLPALTMKARQQHFENPLLRSGLALSGANIGLRDGGDRGLLTAEKVLGLRLRGTEVVVLSACDTGLGDVQVGEGVYGLRRAFLQVGAKSLVMSLWPVPDVETKELMIRFYQNMLSGPMNRAQALRDAVLYEKQVVEKRYGQGHPAYWGAFIFLGEP